MRTIPALALILAAGIAVLPMTATDASGQTGARASDDSTRSAKVRNLRALSMRVTLDVREQPIADIFEFIARVTGADLEPIYLDDTGYEGIDPETLVTIKATNMPALSLLERVLARAQQIERPASNYTWQFTDTGSIEFGPRSVMNRNQVVELYDISDLMFTVPDFNNAPEFDLSSALQSSQGGGGGTSPFQTSGQATDDVPAEDRVRRLIDLIESTVETEQWVTNGGDGASISMFGNSLVVTAPDYVHRQINGYPFWPARLQQVRVVDGRRQIQIRPDTAPTGASSPKP